MSIDFKGTALNLFWKGSPRDIVFDPEQIKEMLKQTDKPLYVIKDFQGRYGVSSVGELVSQGRGLQVLATVNPMTAADLGDPTFRDDYKIKYAYKTGAMANGIASEKLVVSMGKAKLLGSFGAAGLVPERVSQAIDKIQQELPNLPYAFNLIHSPAEEALEAGAVKLYLDKGIHVVEASAFLGLTEHIVKYRVAGLSQNEDGTINIKNKVIAKISRKEIAVHFMQPAPDTFLNTLLEKGEITQVQADLAKKVPMADDITIEADSGGHTDNRAMVALLPGIIGLRDEFQNKYAFAKKIRIGAAGGISTPASALGAFMIGDAYVVTG